ncbi:MAG: hypothetical protein VB138_11020 [Burkholderia sp.]
MSDSSAHDTCPDTALPAAVVDTWRATVCGPGWNTFAIDIYADRTWRLSRIAPGRFHGYLAHPVHSGGPSADIDHDVHTALSSWGREVIIRRRRGETPSAGHARLKPDTSCRRRVHAPANPSRKPCCCR